MTTINDTPGGAAGSAAGQGGEIRTIGQTELGSVEELRWEVDDALSVVDVAAAYLNELARWSTGLGERYSAAPFATTGLTGAVGGLGDTVPTAGALEGITAGLLGLRREIESTAALSEAADGLGAEGSVDAYRAG
jgi:hypothetical protein